MCNLFVEAVLEFILWSQLRSVAGKGWLLLDEIVTLVLAAMIWSTWPSSASWVIGTLVGISIFFSERDFGWRLLRRAKS